MDECTVNLSEKAKQWFQKLGSKEIRNLGYRQGFCFIATKGGKVDAMEKRG